ncbi:TPA: hypothetical protein ACGO3M_000006 [Streptococcus suis]
MESKLELIHMHRAASYYANMQERYDEGVDTEKIDTMKRMIKANLTDEMIAIATEFTVEQVAVFRSQFQIEEGTENGV